MEEIIGMMVALSIAAERMVEITKGVVPFLSCARENPQQEKVRKAILQLLAVGSGVAVTFLAQPMLAGALPEHWSNPTGLIVIGLMASGGSGFWNAILSYLLQVKDVKTQTMRQLAKSNAGTPPPTTGEASATEAAVLRAIKPFHDVAA